MAVPGHAPLTPAAATEAALLLARALGPAPDWPARVGFYSMSECRDLAFNVQEHQLTLGEIEAFLAEQRLRLLGFELDAPVLGQYRARFAHDPCCTDLGNWARFEAANPETFTAMYKFWVQRQQA